jgi:hypothetical protein
MTITNVPAVEHDLCIEDILAYEAPFLIEKLIKNAVVDTAEDAEDLFREVKRYLILADLDQDCSWNMYSLRIDEVWHQFILFTRQYMEFCHRFFGRYIPHNPSNAPKVEYARPIEKTTFEQFYGRYLELFGEPLPDLWYDETTVTLNRRLFSRWAGPLTVRSDGDMVELLNGSGNSLFAVNDLARSALEFIAETGAFYVRELPGGLSDDEKLGLAAVLVECKVLRSAS